MTKTLVLCDCGGTQRLDAEKIGAHCDVRCSRIHTALCTRELESAAKLIAEGDVIIACQQERARFEELAEDIEAEIPDFVDLRDRAGWSEARAPGPKMAALVADAQFAAPAARSIDIPSAGTALVLGSGEVALDAARQLSQALSVTLLLDTEAEPPLDRAFDMVIGKLRKARGSLGNFHVTIDMLRQVEPGGRGPLGFTAPRDGAVSECDVILDLRAAPPLFPAPHKRDGYFRADAGDPLAVARAVFDASHMTGTFEKPLYVKLDEHLCAHSRAEKTGCTRCLDACPTGAITPDGEHVAVDPNICAGCGACSALCPSGAISYDAPAPETLFRRMHNLAQVYRRAGGGVPQLLIHDKDFGAEMISLNARHGRGLPGDVIPLALENIGLFGHAEALAALAAGFGHVHILLSPRADREVLEREAALTAALLGAERASLHDIADPDDLTEAVSIPADAAARDTILPLGRRREVTRLALKTLRPEADEPIALPEGAPYGAVLVDTDACTLCLACAGLCPSGALGDNPDMPQLRFQESACLQCGLCANVCPENAITLVPQMDLRDEAMSQKVLNEEEPFECVECGKPFGVKSTIERIAAQLEGKHPMFAKSAQGRMIRMCDDCRVRAQVHSEDNPFAAGPRPRTRTTDDYLN